jgi:hypothetical protein
VLVVCNFFALAGCGTVFPVVPPEQVQRTERAATEVDLCVLYQERFTRPPWNGVRTTGEPWDSVIASVLIRHPVGLVMVDPAFGRSIAKDLARAGLLFQLVLGTAHGNRPLVEVMDEAGLAPESARCSRTRTGTTPARPATSPTRRYSSRAPSSSGCGPSSASSRAV